MKKSKKVLLIIFKVVNVFTIQKQVLQSVMPNG